MAASPPDFLVKDMTSRNLILIVTDINLDTRKLFVGDLSDLRKLKTLPTAVTKSFIYFLKSEMYFRKQWRRYQMYCRMKLRKFTSKEKPHAYK